MRTRSLFPYPRTRSYFHADFEPAAFAADGAGDEHLPDTRVLVHDVPDRSGRFALLLQHALPARVCERPHDTAQIGVDP